MTAPLRFALVPVDVTSEMRKAAADAWLDCGSRLVLNKAGDAVTAGIAASPGKDLLERIVADLNVSHTLACNYGHIGIAHRLHALLNDLGGGNG